MRKLLVDRGAIQPVRDALKANEARIRATLGDLVHAHVGLATNGPVRAVAVLEVAARTSAHDGLQGELAQAMGVAVEIVQADLTTQLRTKLGGSPFRTSAFEQAIDDAGRPLDFASTETWPGQYQHPANVSLETIEAKMRVTLAASPEEGWPLLEAFLAEPIEHSLVVGMYQFTAPHVYKALASALASDDDATLTLVTHPDAEPIAETGIKASDTSMDVLVARLERKLGDRFEHARATVKNKGAAFGTSYHIKVAVADKKRFWLSSGNWQSSNLPQPDKEDSLEKFNRDLHVVVENKKLATIFDRLLSWDFKDSSKRRLSAPPVSFDVAVRDAPTDFKARQRFPQKVVDDTIRVTPVLTPDNYADVVEPLIRGAKKSVRFLNQYLKPDRFSTYSRLVDALVEKVEAGLDVKLVLRGMPKAEKDALTNRGIPKESVKWRPHNHAKAIIIDDEKVLVGSHNWSNEGTVTNRDASLLFEHADIAQYFAAIFDSDWGVEVPSFGSVLIDDGAEPPVGMRRVDLLDVAADDPDILALLTKDVVADEPVVSVAAPVAETTIIDLVLKVPVRLEVAVRSVTVDTNRIEVVRAEAPMVVAVAPTATPAAPPTPAAPAAPATKKPLVSQAPPTSMVFTSPEREALLAKLVTFNGIDGKTGRYLVPPVPLSQIVLASKRPDGPTLRRPKRLVSFGPAADVDRQSLASAGWGIVFAASTPVDVRNAMKVLIEHRRAQVPADRFKDNLQIDDLASPREWLQSKQVNYGSPMVKRIPLNLLLVGGPDVIPFETQFILAADYNIGRVCFDSTADYERYAQSVVDYETGKKPARERAVSYFATRHASDAATQMSAKQLVTPLIDGEADSDAPTTVIAGFTVKRRVGPAEATQEALAAIFSGATERPAVLFTASHGAGSSTIDPAYQLERQGALMTSLTNPVAGGPSNSFGAKELDDQADVAGLIAFFFACYSAGTPTNDFYPTTLSDEPQAIAESPFVAKLPKRLLAHPKGGALAVVGHVDRAMGFSITFDGALDSTSQIEPYRSFMIEVLRGRSVGNACRNLVERGATLSTVLANATKPGAPATDEFQLALDWMARNDAEAYIILGDPAVHI